LRSSFGSSTSQENVDNIMRGYPIFPQIEKYLSRRQCLILLTWGLILTAAFLRKPDMGEDWESYYVNLDTDDLRVETVKGYWYNYFAIPLGRILGSTERALLAIKLTTVSVFYWVYSRTARSPFDFCLIFVAIIYIPTVSENYQEFLRQGTAMSLLLVALAFHRKVVKYGFYGIAVLFHFVSGLSACLLMITDAVFSARIMKSEAHSNRSAMTVLYAILLFSLLFCLAILGNQDALGELRMESLQGDRSNMLAMACLASYAIYLLYQISHTTQQLHVVTFLLTCFVLAIYPAITDFGRSLSLVTPFHLAGTFLLQKQSDRVVDFLAAFGMGSIFTFV
jgi:hypothetical protein